MIEIKLIIAIIIGVLSVVTLVFVLGSRLPRYFKSEPKNLSRIINNKSIVGLDNDDLDYFGLTSETLLKSIEEADSIGAIRSSSSLTRKFRYAKWTMSPLHFRAFEFSISLLAFSLAALKFNIMVQATMLFCGPVIMHGLLSRSISRRFKAFDADYAQFLMQVVGLLKTGMTAMQALQVASNGLEPKSLVRREVHTMIERVRFGVSEDRSIGAFGEDVDHPEIELFVQALLLSRRLGGNLSDTLERLSSQVRKRQYFRSTAEAAVGLQRGSLWLIIGLLVGLEFYIAILYPDLVFKALEMELGWQVWQSCFVLIAIGIFWIRQVTKIKI